MTKQVDQRKLTALISAGLIDEAIAYLRSQGLTKGTSAIALGRAGMEDGAAKSAVHMSPVWRDRFDADSKFLDSLGRALEELEREGHIRRR